MTRLQAVYVGGSRIPPTVFEQALERLGPRIGVLYGMTEAPVTCYLPPHSLDVNGDRRQRLMESVGPALSGYEVQIANAEGPGEVLIRGGNVTAGYWKQEAASQTLLRDGWLHTGDIGELDDAGNLYIVGRLNDVIRSGSSTIMPKEVEDAIVLHPAVREVAVIGLPDIEWGEAVTAFVVLKPGMASLRTRSGRALPQASRGLQEAALSAVRRRPAALPLRQGDPFAATRPGGELTRAKRSLCL